MAVISTLAVSVIAKTDRFEAGMRKALSVTKDWAGKLGSLAAPLAKVGALTTALAGGGLTVLAAKSASTIDRLSKLSDELGASTEFLSQMQHATELAGTSSEAFEKSLRKMNRTIGDAVTGITEQSKAFEKLGLDVQALADMGADAAFMEIAEAINQQATASERAASAAAIFGRSGQELLVLMSQGREGIMRAREEADRLGLSFSRIDGAQVEAANDALTRVRNMISGGIRQAVIKLAPYVEAVATKLVEWATAGEGVGPKVLAVIRWMLDGTGRLVEAFKIAKGVFEFLVGSITRGFGIILQAISRVVDGLVSIAEVLPGVEFDFDDNFNQFADDVAALGESWQESGADSIRTAGEAREAWLSMLDDVAAASAANAQKVAAAAEARNRVEAKTSEVLEQRLVATQQETDDLAKQWDTLEQSVRTREWMATLSDEERGYARDILEIEDARAKGFDGLARRLEQLLNLKRQEAAATRDQAAAERAAEVDRLEREKRQAEEQADARRLEMLKKSLDLELRLQRAATDDARERIRIMDELNNRLEEAGADQEARALALAIAGEKLADLSERRAQAEAATADAMEKQASAADKRASGAGGDEGGAGGGRGRGGGGGGAGGGSGILGYGARGEIVYEDGSVDKGLQRKRNLRKAQRRLAKYQKQGGGAFATLGGAVGIDPLRDAGDGGLGGMISGRSLETAGVSEFSRFEGTAKYQQPDPAAAAAKAKGPGAPAVVHDTQQLPDASPALEAATKAVEETKESHAKQAKAAEELAAAVEAMGDSATDAMREAVDASKAAVEASKANREELERQKEALAALAAQLPGVG